MVLNCLSPSNMPCTMTTGLYPCTQTPVSSGRTSNSRSGSVGVFISARRSQVGRPAAERCRRSSHSPGQRLYPPGSSGVMMSKVSIALNLCVIDSSSLLPCPCFRRVMLLSFFFLGCCLRSHSVLPIGGRRRHLICVLWREVTK